jgi:molybdate transport system substrate-binding protein
MHCLFITRRTVLALALCFIAPLAACGDSGGDGSGPDAAAGALTIAAASSLRDPLRAYGNAAPGEERFSFAGSDQLAAQIRRGAPADIYASADPRYAEELAGEGVVSEPTIFARNRLVAAVPADSPLRSLEGLAAPGVDLVIGAAGVPAGEYAREAIAGLDPGTREAIEANVRSEEADVKGVVGKLLQGAADAGFVYSTDVAATNGALRAIELPSGLAPEVSYAIAIGSESGQPERAQRFIEGLLEGPGAEALAAAGFQAPGGRR